MCAAARHPDNKCAASSANKATIEGIIDLAIKETNEAFAESGIPTKLRLVKLHYDDQYDDTAFQWPTVFSHFTGNNDGYLDYIHAMRDQYGADFVSFIVNSRGYCGSGHRPREPSPDRAFSMVRLSLKEIWFMLVEQRSQSVLLLALHRSDGIALQGIIRSHMN